MSPTESTLRDRIVYATFLLLAGLVIAAFALERSSEIVDIVRQLVILLSVLLVGEAAAEAMGSWRSIADAIGNLSSTAQTPDVKEGDNDGE